MALPTLAVPRQLFARNGLDYEGLSEQRSRKR
jgi:hypothetical protein